MYKVLLYLFILLSGSYLQSNKTNAKKWVITSGCSLKVEGSTNVNNFSCVITNYSIPDTILVTQHIPHSVQLNGNIKLDIQNFNCHNPVMTADLRKTLKAKEFPKLIIRFISINQYPDSNTRHKISKGIIEIELAGVSKRFEVDYKIISAESNYINLEGSRNLNFSDFKINPPTRLGGMIRTNNELNVVFNLRMIVLN
jgi:hypothetical protein